MCIFGELKTFFWGGTPFILLYLRVCKGRSTCSAVCLALPSEFHDVLLQCQEALSYSGLSESESQGVARLRLDFEKPPDLAGQQSA